mmetsp:Transcript_34669/g.83888  ORF Transcript_34669/g.83888 Transcript_34669/m.83888 type:complete len:312 (-) Transcript_34669:167-1102(-)
MRTTSTTSTATSSLPPLQPPLRVIGVQLAPAATVEANLARSAGAIRRVHYSRKGRAPCRLYVLPELSANGYSDAVLATLESEAEDAETGRITTYFRELAREVDAYICYGFLRKQGNMDCSPRNGATPRYTICQAVVDPRGKLILAYNKMHLCDMGDCSEVAYGLSRGDTPGVFECDGVRVGLTVCYDIRFPELFRKLAWEEECTLILHPAAFIRDATFATYHQFTVARAVENGVYLLSVNYAGEKFGESNAVPPWIGPVPGLSGKKLQKVTLDCSEDVLSLIVEPDVLKAVWTSYPYRRDSRRLGILRARL